MTFSSKVIHIKSKSENMCNYCKQNFACGNLKAALKELETEAKEAIDTYSIDLYLNFKKKLEKYGYNYPNAQSLCWLHDKRTVIQSLIEEAKQLAVEIRQKRTPCRPAAYRNVSLRK